jgi:hypothetical protein
MTVFEFQLLSLTDQLDLLYVHGVYIGKRRCGNQRIVLYQFEGYYVEVFYSKYRCYPERLRCFRSTVLLDPYLENMELTVT